MSNNIEEDIKIVEEIRKDLGLYVDSKKVRQGMALENVLNNCKKNKQIVDEIRGKINERQFELQQEYKEFKDDIRLNTLQEIYYMFEEE